MKEARKKVKTLGEIIAIVRSARRKGKTIITTNGCFDLLHIGHLRGLQFAKSKAGKRGGILIMGINSDASVRKLKGPTRPITPQKERAEMLAGLACVDYVFIFNGTPTDWIKKIKPDIQVKSSDVQKIPAFWDEKKEVERYGGRVVLAPYVKGRSTTRLIEKFLRAYTKVPPLK